MSVLVRNMNLVANCPIIELHDLVTIVQKWKEHRMVKLEINNAASVVRIHDDYCQSTTDCQLNKLNQIVADAYKRRQLEEKSNPPKS